MALLSLDFVLSACVLDLATSLTIKQVKTSSELGKGTWKNLRPQGYS